MEGCDPFSAWLYLHSKWCIWVFDGFRRAVAIVEAEKGGEQRHCLYPPPPLPSCANHLERVIKSTLSARLDSSLPMCVCVLDTKLREIDGLDSLILRVSSSKDKCSTATSRTVCYSWHRRWSTAWRHWRVEASSSRTSPFTTLREISSSSENRLVPRLVSLFFFSFFKSYLFLFDYFIVLVFLIVSAKEIRITLKRNVIRQSVP